MRPSGVHGNSVYRYSFLSPLTLSGFLALLTLSSFLLRILQAYKTKCIAVALLRLGALVPRQRRQEALASSLLTQLCVSIPALWRGVGFCVGLLRP